MNMCGNAVRFTEQGSVAIRVHHGPDPQDRPAHALLVMVIDTGIGIPEDRADSIFEKFTQAYSDTTRKYGGTGLGLTISKRLAELQGGSISVKSERDKVACSRCGCPTAPGDRHQQPQASIEPNFTTTVWGAFAGYAPSP
ncbi:MAG: hypothetical protein IPM68_05740 [Flavobacteriales bacterium]|nr:hypothetical protein [Flavobacteriales bacterium]